MAKTRLEKVYVEVPADLLEEFDRETSGFYISRNEAIRAGIRMIIDPEIRTALQKVDENAKLFAKSTAQNLLMLRQRAADLNRENYLRSLQLALHAHSERVWNAIWQYW